MAAAYTPSNPAFKGVAFSVQIALKDNANPGSFKAAPTIAASGDFKCSGASTGGSPGAMTDMTVVPVVGPAGSIWVNVQFSAAEMNFDQVWFQGIDQTNPKEWADVAFCINTCPVVRGLAGTALPAAAADAAGGLPISDAGGLDLDLKIGNLPSVAAGTNGGVVIAGSNAATTFAGLTTGALSCSTITASGAVAFQSTFAVTTSTSLAAISGSTVTFSGAVALQSTLAVTGATTLTGAVTASNAGNNIVGIDVAKLGGVAQSLTDLKDFADTGYDPSTHKVQGVLLTDTATALGAAYDAAKTAASATNLATANTNISALITTVGIAGAGLTAIDLPDQTMNITGNITGNLSGSVGSVTAGVTLANGAHGGVAAVLTLERIVVASTTLNEPAFKLTGNGTGAGILSTGGATSGVGIKAQGSGSSGHGISASSGSGALGTGILATSNATNGNGFSGVGQGTGDGMQLLAGDTGHGLHSIGGSTSGAGIRVEGTAGNANGLECVANGSGADIDADILGNITGNLSGSVGSVTGLTNATVAAAVEAAILNEGDATALLAAIAAKVEEFLINEGDATATLAAIGAAVRTNLTTELGRIDVAVSTRGTGTALTAAQVNAEVDTALADYDGPTHTELTSELATADDAVLSAIAALNDISAADILAMTYEGAETFQDFMRLARAALAGKANGLETTTVHFRDAADSKNRITATVDADGNRTAVTVDAS